MLTQDTQGASERDETYVEITSYREAIEVFRSNKMSTAIESDRDAELFRGGTILRLHGSDHTRRRRVFNRLVRRDGHQWFRDTHLYPTMARCIAELDAMAGSDGIVHADVRHLVQRVNIRLGAAIAGIDQVATAEGADELVRLLAEMSEFSTLFEGESLLDRVDGPKLADDFGSKAYRAKAEFVANFYNPSVHRRRELVERVERGEMTEEDLPIDVATFVAQRADPAYSDSGIAEREVLMAIRASVNTSAHMLAWATVELENWFDAHPEDRALATDPEFLLGAVNETNRLHVIRPRARRAMEDVSLSTGREIPAGAFVNILTPQVSRDPEVYGPDADVFNPRRELPDTAYPYGLAFGSGQHMCLGLPLVLGNEGLDGSLVYTMKAFYEAGMRRDPDRVAERREGDAYAAIGEDSLSTCPVIFQRSGSA